MNCQRIRIWIILILILLQLVVASAYAAENTIPQLREFPVDFSLEWSVSYTPEARSSFSQMSVREDGWFALVSRSASSDDPKAVVVHIDVYNETGCFQKSLSYLTPAGGDDVELTDRAIQVYFYSEMLSFDLETDVLTAYAIPDNAVMDSGLHSELMKSTVEKNGWVYTAKKEFLGAYTKLVRTNETEAQTLIELSGTESDWVKTLLSFTQAAILLFLIPWIVRYVRKRQKQHTLQKNDLTQYTIEAIPDDPYSPNE